MPRLISLGIALDVLVGVFVVTLEVFMRELLITSAERAIRYLST